MKYNNHKLQHQQRKKIIKEDSFIVSEKKNSSVIHLIIAFCLPVLLYLQTINFGFTGFDDDSIIVNNISFLRHIGNAPQAFFTDAFIDKSSSFYRPLQTLSYMIDIHLSGANKTWMFHLTDILLLGFISCLLFLLFRRFSIPKNLALFGTLIYCAHPLFISSVAWIPARGDLMLMLFSLLSFLFFIDFLRNKKIICLLLNWAAFIIALFCKETAAFLPFLFIIYYFTFHKGKRFEGKYAFLIILYAVSGLFWFWLRYKAIGGISNRNDVFELVPFLMNFRTIPESVAKFFLPFDIAPIPAFSKFDTMIGIGIIAILVTLYINKKERPTKEFIFCFSWFLLLMLPAMFYKHPFIDYLNHRFFLPLIGILLFVLLLLPERRTKKGIIKQYWLIIAVFLVLSTSTFIKSRSYSDPLTFYSSAVVQNPNSAIAYINLGYLKNAENDFQGAVDDYNKSIAISPNYPDAYNNRGVSKANMGDKQGAVDDYNKAIAINPNYSDAYNNRGIAKATMGDNAGAMSDFDKAVSINPNYSDAYCNRAITRYTLKDYAGVIEDCNKMLQLNPND
ncbi:MAG: tetratricopeptide repeat protein, partial [Bacteroidales bacterium]